MIRSKHSLVFGTLGGAALLHLVLAACGQPSSSVARCDSGNCSPDSSAPGGDLPSGVIMAFGGTSAPDGWLACNGQAVSRTQYASLFAAIGTANGSGDGVTTFLVPDYRGRFLRGVDQGAGNDPDATSRTAPAAGGNAGDAVGSLEAGAFAQHTHAVVDPGHSHGVNDPGHSHGVSDPGHGHTGCMGEGIYWQNGGQSTTYTTALLDEFNACFGTGMVQPSQTGIGIQASGTGISLATSETHVTVSSAGGSETRPANAAVLWIIKT
jgi:microcystin-dependent protein